VKVGQRVTVTVMEVDPERNRIGLSMKARPDLTPRKPGQGDSGPRRAPENKPRSQGFSNSAFADAFGKLKT
jgi:transcriptional accessory protein Tex/SPT6